MLEEVGASRPALIGPNRRLRPGKGKDLSKVTQRVNSPVTIQPYSTPPSPPRKMVTPSFPPEVSLITHQSPLSHPWPLHAPVQENLGYSETCLPCPFPAPWAGDSLRAGIQTLQSRLPGLGVGAAHREAPPPPLMFVSPGGSDHPSI